MSEPIKIGDICIGQKFVIDIDRNDMECEVLEYADRAVGIDAHGGIHLGPAYFVRWADGIERSVGPANLRKKPPQVSGEQLILSLFTTPRIEQPAEELAPA